MVSDVEEFDWADSIHKPTWEANATVASEILWDDSFEGWGEKKKWAAVLECRWCIVMSENPSPKSPYNLLHAEFSFQIEDKPARGKFHFSLRKRPEG